MRTEKSLDRARRLVGIDLHTRQLHVDQDAGQGPLHRLVDSQQVFAAEARAQVLVEAQGDVGVLGRVAGRGVQRHMLEALLPLAGPGHGLEADRLVLQPALGQLVHAVALVQAAFEHEGDQHGVVHRRHVDAVPREDGDVVLGVLGDLEDAGSSSSGFSRSMASARGIWSRADLGSKSKPPSLSCSWPTGM
jgi:hypothetical protein